MFALVLTAPLVALAVSDDELRHFAGVRVLYALVARDGERLGASAARVGDLDHDGVRDFVLTRHSLGPGSDLDVCAFSARTGARLWSAREPHFGDRLEAGPEPRSLAGIGDVDADGVDDLALEALNPVGAECVHVRSGADGHLVARIVESGRGLAPHVLRSDYLRADTSTLRLSTSECGTVLTPAGDLDGDGANDFLVSATWWCQPNEFWAISSRTLKPLFMACGLPLGSVAEREGRADVLALAMCEDRARAELLSAHAGRVLARAAASVDAICALGDLDGDGRLDYGRVQLDQVPPPPPKPSFATTFAPPRPKVALPTWPVSLRAWSGRTNVLLVDREIDRVPAGTWVSGGACGDLDGDGRGELWFARDVHSGPRTLLFYSTTFSGVLAGSEVIEIARIESSSPSFGARVVNLGDIDGDGSVELLVTEPERGGNHCARVLSFRESLPR